MNNIAIILILLLLIILLISKKYEYFEENETEENETEGNETEENLNSEEKPTKKNPTNFLLDDIYEKTTQYDNDNGRLGIDICLEKCKGNCVELGISGFSFCFD